MSDPFISEIRAFAFNFNPRGWAFCSGSLLPISQNTALFSLLGTNYGGDGKSTFRLPNLASRALCQAGTGPGLSGRDLGAAFGTETVSLDESAMPPHTHGLVAYSQSAPGTGSYTPVSGGGLSFLASNTGARTYGAPGSAQMGAAMIQPNSGGLPHENRQPYLAMNFCIALQGIFPQRP